MISTDNKGALMEKVSRIKFKDLKKGNKGFEIIPLKGFFESTDSSFFGKQFRTDFYNVIYTTKGTSVHEIDFVEYTVNANELLIVSSNRVHKYSSFEDSEGYLIMFTEGFLCEYLSNNSSEIKDLFSDTYMNPHLKSLDLYATMFNKLLDALYYSYSNLNSIINYELIASTFKSFGQLVINIRLAEEASDKRNNEIFIQFTKLVDEFIYKEKTVDGYANMMHVSKKTVNLMTRRAVDISAKQYIIQQLIFKIKLKLSFEQKSINQISDELGFTEPSNMTKFFKKYTGVSPKTFRNENSNSHDSMTNKGFDLDSIRDAIEVKVYHITNEAIVPLHKHVKIDELFYCIKGSGFGVSEDGEVELNVGDAFIASAGTIHALRSEGDLYVVSVLVPVGG